MFEWRSHSLHHMLTRRQAQDKKTEMSLNFLQSSAQMCLVQSNGKKSLQFMYSKSLIRLDVLY